MCLTCVCSRVSFHICTAQHELLLLRLFPQKVEILPKSLVSCTVFLGAPLLFNWANPNKPLPHTHTHWLHQAAFPKRAQRCCWALASNLRRMAQTQHIVCLFTVDSGGSSTTITVTTTVMHHRSLLQPAHSQKKERVSYRARLLLGPSSFLSLPASLHCFHTADLPPSVMASVCCRCKLQRNIKSWKMILLILGSLKFELSARIKADYGHPVKVYANWGFVRVLFFLCVLFCCNKPNNELLSITIKISRYNIGVRNLAIAKFYVLVNISHLNLFATKGAVLYQPALSQTVVALKQ